MKEFKSCDCPYKEGYMHKIAAIIIKGEKILVVKKEHEKTGFILPGGKHENMESPKVTLERELMEELQVRVKDLKYYGTYQGIAYHDEVPLIMDCYIVKIEGQTSPDSEIIEAIWAGRDWGNDLDIGAALAKDVIKDLIKDGLI